MVGADEFTGWASDVLVVAPDEKDPDAVVADKLPEIIEMSILDLPKNRCVPHCCYTPVGVEAGLSVPVYGPTPMSRCRIFCDLERNPENVVHSDSVTDAVFRQIARKSRNLEHDPIQPERIVL